MPPSATQPDITLQQAKAIVRTFLKQNFIGYDKLTGRVVGFSDLARTSRVFVTIHGWQPSPKAEELEQLAREAGFYVEFVR